MAHPQGDVPFEAEPERANLQSAWRVSLFSVTWTLAAGSAAIAIGVAQGSAVLIAFGCVGFVDAAGSAALAYHFRHAVRHDTLAGHLEHFAHRVVMFGLILVGFAAVAIGGIRLASQPVAESGPIGTMLAAVSFAVLLALANAKRRLAPRVKSPALRSDGHLSSIGAMQAAVTVFGVAATAAGWRWADPTAAIAVGTVATIIGVQSWARARPARLPT